jgi:flagellar biosynthesis/type III secretory pathway M-ring protein FliF/YscJ
MDHRLANFQGSAMLSTRAIALFALVIAGVLGSWRASDLFTQPVEAWVPGSAVETSLMGILEPVAGTGNIRLSVTGNGGSGRSVLILLSSDASETAPTLQRLATSAILLSPETGDQLIIEQADFAHGVAGRPDATGWTELGLYALLCGLLAWVGFRAPVDAATEGKGAAVPVEPKAARVDPADISPKPKLRAVRQTDPDAASLVRKDPARTASILRSWMRGEGDAA